MSDQATTIAASIGVALFGGGTMAGAIIWIAKRLVAALISQNAKLTLAIDQNTKATSDLAEIIRTELKQHDVRDQERLRQMDKIEECVNKNTSATLTLVERLRGRL